MIRKPGAYSSSLKQKSGSGTVSPSPGVPSSLYSKPANRHRHGKDSVDKKNPLSMLTIKTPRLNKNKTPYVRKKREDGHIGIGRAPGIDLVGTYSQHGSQKTLNKKLKKNRTK